MGTEVLGIKLSDRENTGEKKEQIACDIYYLTFSW